jgi:nicotinate dehydrogenase subunit B
MHLPKAIQRRGITRQVAPLIESFKNSVISSKVAAKETWATDVRLPGMLHARVIHPKTLGSTLVSAGPLDKTKFPNSQVIVKSNLVGVVAPTEWEAIQAAEQVAGGTKWTDWKGLPGNAKLYDYLRQEADWTSTPVTQGDANKGALAATLAGAHKKLSATYQFSYMKHAPIGPTMAVADVKPDGTVHIYTQPESTSAPRRNCHDAPHHARSCDRARVSRTRTLRTIERRKRRR